MSSLPPLPFMRPFLRRYDLFISHAWDYKGEYEGLVNLLNLVPNFVWNNLSVPEERPLQVMLLLPRSYRYLVRQLDERISQADCVLVLAGMYVSHRGWIQSEIEAAKEFHKPIIAVEPRGSERFPEAVMHAADERVGWNSVSIVSAIRRHAGIPPLIAPPTLR